MELNVQNINYQYKNKNLLKNLSFKLEDSYIYGITGSHKTLLLEIIDDMKEYEGNISIDNITNKEKLKYRRAVSLIQQNNEFFTDTVIEEMDFIINNLKYENQNIRKKEIDSLKLVGLKEEYLFRNISSLSETEKILVSISCNLLTNPKVIMFDEIFTNLDLINRKRILDLIRRLKNNYHKIIIISTKDTNFLYSYTDYMLILNNNSLIKFDETSKVFKDFDFLEKNNIDIPYLVDFTKKAKDKKIRLMYHKDILDLIKDVYKHV